MKEKEQEQEVKEKETLNGEERVEEKEKAPSGMVDACASLDHDIHGDEGDDEVGEGVEVQEGVVRGVVLLPHWPLD